MAQTLTPDRFLDHDPECQREDTAALGLAAHTPLIAATAFRAGPGAALRVPGPFAVHCMILFDRCDSVIRHGRDPGIQHQAAAGDEFLLIPAGLPMDLTWTGPVSGLALWLDPEGVRRFVAEQMRILVDEEALASAWRLRDPVAARTARLIRDEVFADGPGQGVVFEGLSKALLAGIVRRHAPQIAGGADGLGLDRYRAVADLVAQRLGDRIGPEDMARVAGLSVSAFAGRFRRATGRTPMAFVADMRIARAREMLAGEDGLAEIASRCGFADQAHFGRVFKKATGQTPRAFRLSLRG